MAASSSYLVRAIVKKHTDNQERSENALKKLFLCAPLSNHKIILTLFYEFSIF